MNEGRSAVTAGAALGSTQRLQRLKAAPRRPGEASFFYYDAHFGNEAVKVLPGEYFVHDEDLLITTTLGSCFAACLWDRQLKIGGMKHLLLPDAGAGGRDGERHVGFAMEGLINELIQRGAMRSTMEAKVFGGGAVITGQKSSHVGERDSRFVLDCLAAERITVVSRDLMDVYPRKVCFLPHSGKAMVKRLSAATRQSVLDQEHAALQKITPAESADGAIGRAAKRPDGQAPTS